MEIIIGDRSEIEKLPKKLIAQILSYLHPKQLRLCASVCRLFYTVVISMETTSCIVLKSVQDIVQFREILQTSRTIGSIRIGHPTKTISCTERCWNALFAIFRRHGPNLRNISFENVNIAREDIEVLLGCCISYRSLNLQWVYSNIEFHGILNCGVVNEYNKEITMKHCDEKIQSMILTLAPGTVSSLDFFCCSNANVERFFRLQKTIKNVSIRYYKDNVNLSNLLPDKIESFEFGSYLNQSSLIVALSKLNCLQRLDLSCATINNDVFKAACNICGLRSLKVSVNNIGIEAFRHINKSHQLEELTLIKNDNCVEVNLKVLAQSKLPKLRKLELLYPTTSIKMGVYKELVSNLKLEHFYVSSIISPKSFHEVINQSNSPFRTLKVQDPQFSLESSKAFFNSVNNVCCFENINLRELILDIDTEFITSVGRVFPNLQKLEFKTSLEPQKLCEIIFTGLKNLTELRIDNQLPIDLLNLGVTKLLLQHGPRFKYISLFTSMTVLLSVLRSIYGRTFVEIKRNWFFTEFIN